MNQTILDQASKVLEGAASAAASMKGFAQAHLPELCRQIVSYELWSNAFLAVIWLGIVTACAGLSLRFHRLYYAEHRKGNGEAECCLTVLCTCVAIFALVGFFIEAYGCLEPLVAPDLTVLRYLKALVK